MARQTRFILPDVAVHVIQRGNDRMVCFRSDDDCMVYLALLRQLSASFGCVLHAYCLMSNHTHLLMTPRVVRACTVLMKHLGQRYVQYFNRRYERTGTLWEGRFRSCVVQSARYVLACYRYIELNPVRAGMVGHPSAYHWSSYLVNAGDREDPLILPHPEMQALGLESRSQQAAYRALVDDGLDASLLNAIREATNGGYPLCSDSFKSKLMLPAGRKIDRDRPGPRPSRSRKATKGDRGLTPNYSV